MRNWRRHRLIGKYFSSALGSCHGRGFVCRIRPQPGHACLQGLVYKDVRPTVQQPITGICAAKGLVPAGACSPGARLIAGVHKVISPPVAPLHMREMCHLYLGGSSAHDSAWHPGERQHPFGLRERVEHTLAQPRCPDMCEATNAKCR